MEFFTKKEIDTFREVANKEYNPDDPHHIEEIRPVLLGIQKKTNYWAKEIVKSNPELTYERQGNYNKLYHHIYKPYAWAIIYKKTDKGKGIFFTVGGDTNSMGLVYKLDYQYEGDTLSEDKKKLCKPLIKLPNAPWIWNQVDYDIIEQYAWKKLINETSDFIHKYLSIYSEIIDKIWNQQKKQTDTTASKNNDFILKKKSKINNANDSTGTPTIYERKEQSIIVSYLHKTISSELYAYLSEKFGEENIYDENNTGFGTYVDIVVEHENIYTFYEIKTYNSVRSSIREAIGQLLEYNYWINRNIAKEMIIVTQKSNEESENKDGITYIKHLRETLHIPIYIIYYDIENKTFSEKY